MGIAHEGVLADAKRCSIDIATGLDKSGPTKAMTERAWMHLSCLVRNVLAGPLRRVWLVCALSSPLFVAFSMTKGRISRAAKSIRNAAPACCQYIEWRDRRPVHDILE